MTRYKRALPVGVLFILAAAFLVLAPATATDVARVAQVLDGDSVRLADGREIRLIGINAPEFGKSGMPDEPLAREARAALTHLVGGKAIQLEYNAERNDRYGRALAHVSLADGTRVQTLLLRQGMAFHIAQPPNLMHLDEYRAAEADARRARLGVWNHSYYKPREAERLGTRESGFRFVEGRIQRIGRGPNTIYLDLTPHFTLSIPQQDWHFFDGDPQRFLHHRVIARGWVTLHDNRSRMRLPHPAMLEVID